MRRGALWPLVAILACGCFLDPVDRHTTRERSPSARWNAIMDTLQGVLLPDFGGARSWRRAGPLIAPAVDAPTCASAAPASDWRAVSLDVYSRYLSGTVTANLPGQHPVVRPLTGAERFSPPYTSWPVFGTWHADSAGGLGVLVAVDPIDAGGYRGTSVDSTTRQVAWSECVTDRPVPGTAILTTEVVAPNVGHVWFVEAVWPIGPSRWLRARGSTRVAADVATLRAIVASFRVTQSE
jgi:hypothetical protein